jgi:adenylate cyclase
VSEATSYRFDQFTVDLQSACLQYAGAPVPLRPKSFDVLLYLVRNHGRLVSKNELIDSVWSNVTVTDNSLVQCIKEIREALKDDQQTIVETVPKRGYVFAPAVVEIDDAGLSAVVPAPVGEASSSTQWIPISKLPPRSTWIGVAATGSIATLVIAGGLWLALGPTITQQPLSDTSSYDRASVDKRLSIAVMPFGTSETGGDDYFSTGISEDIADALGRFAELAVASPKVVSRFRNVGVNPEDIERQLKVRYLVEGTARKSSEGMRLTVRLTDLPRGVLLWSHSYDVTIPTELAVQDKIAVQIAGTLSVRLTNVEQRRVTSKSATSMEAYDFSLRGRELLKRLNRTSYSQARIMFERAIALDPGYAAAYVGLGRADLGAVEMGWTADAAQALERAESLARKAISLDEYSASAHVLLGRTYVREGKHDRAAEVLNRAVALNPSDPECYAGLGDVLLWSGDSAAAMKALETAISMDPGLSAKDLFNLGVAYFLEGRAADSIRVFERVTMRNEGNPFIFAMLAAVYAENGREADAQVAAATVRQLNPLFDVENFGTLFKNPEHRDKLARALTKTGL